MSTFGNFILNQEYADLAARGGDPPLGISSMIDWERFRPLLSSAYLSDTELGGHPHTSVIVLMKLLVLQQWYGLSDYELERQASDRISFRHFLNFPATIPDRSTIWSFKNRLIEAEVLDAIWNELQHQILELDAFKTLRRIWGILLNSASLLRVNQIFEKTWYLSKVRFSTINIVSSGMRRLSVQIPVMHRAVRDHPLSIKEKRGNRAISRVRSLVERTYAVIKRQFHTVNVLITTVARASLQNLFACFHYNLAQLRTIHRRALEER